MNGPNASPVPPDQLAWKYRMVYAPSEDFLNWAAEIGADWAVVDSYGHLGNEKEGLKDDVPVLLEEYPQIAELRRPNQGKIAEDVGVIQSAIDRARKLGMKSALASYQVSLPAEVKDVYRELFEPPVDEVRRFVPERLWEWTPCLSNPEVRRMLTSCLRETLDQFRGLDGFIYSFHESMFNATVTHRCQRCREIPYAQMLRWLYDCVKEAAGAAKHRPRIFIRCWGMLHAEAVYFRMRELIHQWGLRPPNRPAADWAPDIGALRYSPHRDFPAFLQQMRGEDVVFLSKLSYGDFNLGQPTSPWVGKITGFDHIVELSFEHVQAGKSTLAIIPEHFKRFDQTARQAGVAGVALVPTTWGTRHDRPVSWSYAGGNRAAMGLNAANFGAAAEAFKQEPRFRDAIRRWLSAMYQFEAPESLVDLLTETEMAAGKMTTWNGVSYLMNFNLSHSWPVMDSLNTRRTNALWYASHYDDGLQRLEPTPWNVEVIWKGHDEALKIARSLPERLRELVSVASAFPAPAAAEIADHLEYFRDWMECYWLSQRIMLRLWQWERGYAHIVPQISEQLLGWISRRTYLVAHRPELQRLWWDHLSAQ